MKKIMRNIKSFIKRIIGQILLRSMDIRSDELWEKMYYVKGEERERTRQMYDKEYENKFKVIEWMYD